MAQVEYVPDVGVLWEVLRGGPLADPVSVVLIALGGMFVFVSLAVFAGLSLGGVLSLLARPA